MFTGLIETTGTVTEIAHRNDAVLSLAIKSDLEDIEIGDSISVNGCCLTAVQIAEDTFFVEVVAETISRTNLSKLQPHDRVNLERALRTGDRLGGHFVQGHIDTTGRVVQLPPSLAIRIPQDIRPFVAMKGSIAVNGVSLTVANVTENLVFIAVIPHTLANTNLSELSIGSEVNIEVDMIARYVENLIKTKDI